MEGASYRGAAQAYRGKNTYEKRQEEGWGRGGGHPLRLICMIPTRADGRRGLARAIHWVVRYQPGQEDKPDMRGGGEGGGVAFIRMGEPALR